jgi:NhaP-type Na+/H+ or K+/H+ antiporter
MLAPLCLLATAAAPLQAASEATGGGPAPMHSAVQTLALSLGVGSLVTLACMRLRTPPILPLLIVGFVLGRGGIGLVDGASLQAGLMAVVTVAVGLLIFEGSLGLDRSVFAQAPRAVRGLLTIGVIVAWVLGAVVARYTLGLDWNFATLLGAMLVVTGPTVVQPILRRVIVKPNVRSALGAEAILIDPIGVVLAVSTLEIVRTGIESGSSGGVLVMARLYLLPLAAGFVLGTAAGFAAVAVMRRQTGVGHGRDLFLALLGMGVCMVSFGLSEKWAHESGLVAAAMAGMIIANAHVVGAEELRRFKEQISVMLVGALFILLASRIEFAQLKLIGLPEVLFAGLLILVVRPASVFAATIGTVLSVREKLFISLVAPRGIVATALGSIVALELARVGRAIENPDLIETGRRIEAVVLLVIFSTVAISGAFAGMLATVLRVRAGAPNGLIIVGAHRLGRELARELMGHGVPVKLVDTNAANIAAATALDIPAALGDATDASWLDTEVASPQMGWLLAITDNTDVDRVAARWALQRFGPGHAFRWFREEPAADERIGVAMQWGRPLRHLLFQIDTNLARVASWEGQRENAVPVALLDQEGHMKLAPGDIPADDILEDRTVVGLVIGPAPRDEPAADQPEA